MKYKSKRQIQQEIIHQEGVEIAMEGWEKLLVAASLLGSETALGILVATILEMLAEANNLELTR